MYKVFLAVGSLFLMSFSSIALAAEVKDSFSQCLWQVICTYKNSGSNKVVTRNESMEAESVCK